MTERLMAKRVNHTMKDSPRSAYVFQYERAPPDVSNQKLEKIVNVLRNWH